MRGWSSFFVGFLLLGVAYWSYSADGFGTSTLMCGAAAAFCFFCGANGRAVSENGDPTAVIDFIKDPADAIVDSATDRLAEWMGERKAADEKAGFDPDAALARYMENRQPQPAAVPDVAAPVRSFGRKGL